MLICHERKKPSWTSFTNGDYRNQHWAWINNYIHKKFWSASPQPRAQCQRWNGETDIKAMA